MVTITVTGDQGWTQYSPGSPKNADIIDCDGASWNANNLGSPQEAYPVYVTDWNVPVELRGGTINGSYSQTKSWGNMYQDGNGAAVFIKRGKDGSSVRNWTMTNVWDGVRITGVSDYLIENIVIDGTRDDATECDAGLPGIIRNCKFTRCFSGISVGDANTPASSLQNVVEVDRCLVGCTVYNYDGDPAQHVAPFKAGANSPNLLVKNSVFAVERADHKNLPRLTTALSRVRAESFGNYWLNLSDDDLPGDYPTIPASFTYLQGQPARDYWAAAQAAYDAGNPPPDVDPDPPTVLPEILHVLEVNPTSGAIKAQTPEAYVAEVTVGATNTSGSHTRTVTVTVA